MTVFLVAYFLLGGLGALLKGAAQNLANLTPLIIRRAALITLLFVLFWRDIRLLGRFLGPSRGAGRSIVIVLVIFLLTGAATATLLGFGLLGGLRPGPERNPGGEFIFERLVKPIVNVCKAGPSVDPGKVAALAFGTGTLGLVLGPMVEELFFRGACFLLLLRVVGKWPAALLTSMMFAGAHQIGFSNISWLMFAVQTLVGLALCVVLFYTHRLRWCILMHSMWNTGLVAILILLFALL